MPFQLHNIAVKLRQLFYEWIFKISLHIHDFYIHIHIYTVSMFRHINYRNTLTTVLIAINIQNPKERRTTTMTPTILASGAGATSIDSSMITELINLCKQCMGLFTEFPLNVFLVGGLVSIGFGIFRNAKGAARS